MNKYFVYQYLRVSSHVVFIQLLGNEDSDLVRNFKLITKHVPRDNGRCLLHTWQYPNGGTSGRLDAGFQLDGSGLWAGR